jgi:hypothetical protein
MTDRDIHLPPSAAVESPFQWVYSPYLSSSFQDLRMPDERLKDNDY